MKPNPLLAAVALCLALLMARPASAKCHITGVSQTEDSRTARIDFGRVNLASAYLQPPGTLLASIIVPPTNYTWGGAHAESVLWYCDKSDLKNLHFLVSTNGDARHNGHNDIGAADNLSDVYATWFEYIGLRQSMAGVTLSRHWKKVELQDYDQDKNCEDWRDKHTRKPLKDKICIRLKHIPPLHAELYRVRTLPPASGPTWGGCTPMAKIRPPPASNLYTCIQPSSYIQLAGSIKHGPGHIGIRHDMEGEDHNNHYQFWWADNGFGYGMHGATSFSSTPTCVARSATPQVLFPAISVNDLNTGKSATTNFSVQLECSSEAISGTGKDETAIGLQASPGALAAAQRLNGLVNASGGVQYLLSDDYGAVGVARGVGIRLQRAADNAEVFFLGRGSTGGRTEAGWNSFMRGADMTGLSPQPGYSHWNLEFNAILEALPKATGETITPGKVRATAHVLVKVQ